MSALKGWLVRVRRAINPTAIEKQMAEEMRLHLELETAARQAAGENPNDARRAAAVDFGHTEALKEQVRDRRLGRWLAETIQDLRYAAQMLRRSPGFSAAVIVTLGLGIGINTALFTGISPVLFGTIALPNADRLVTVTDVNLPHTHRPGVAWPDYLAYRAQNTVFETLEAGSLESATLGDNTQAAEPVRLMRATPSLLGLAGTAPQLGRLFIAADGFPGAEAVVLIGDHLWQTRYGGAGDVIGRVVQVNGQPATIVGVMPPEFKFPVLEDLWMPLRPTPELENRTQHDLVMMGLLKHGVTSDRADQDLAVITSRLAAEPPAEITPVTVATRPFLKIFIGADGLAAARLMFVAVGLVLAIVCANVANLLLSRGLARSRELSMRAALGAGRGRLLRQLLTESVFLGACGGLLGVAVAALGAHGLKLATNNTGMPFWIRFELNLPALLYVTALSVGCGILFGLVPAWRASRIDLNEALKNGAPSATARREGWLAGGLTVLQFTLSLVLLAGAGMISRSFAALDAYNPTIPEEQILTAAIRLPDQAGQAYADPAARLRVLEQLLARLRALPGVTHAATMSQLPGLGGNNTRLEIEGRPAVPLKDAPRSTYLVISPNALVTIGLTLRQGRSLQETDGALGLERAVVTQTFALTHWPNEISLGKRFRFVTEKDAGPWIEIVGESTDLQAHPTDLQPGPIVFLPDKQMPPGRTFLLLRTTGDPTDLTSAIRSAVAVIDRDILLHRVKPLVEALDEIRWSNRLFGVLFLVFSTTGLLTAAIGVYATVASATNRRTREIGVRMALGATPGRVIRLIIRQGMRQVIVGVILGLAGGVVFTDVLRQTGMILRVPQPDPLLFALLAGFVAGLGVLACVLPARRATRVAPTEALRAE